MTGFPNREPDGSPAIPPRPGGGSATAVLERPERQDYLKLSPTQIGSLTCPAEYWYRYVEHLESAKKASFFALGTAIHAGIEFAYARRKTEITPEEVADVAEHHLRVADKNGISYKPERKDKPAEALDDYTVMKKVSRKKDAVPEPAVIPGLVTQARQLVSLWWLLDRERVIALDDAVTEISLTYALDGDTEFTCRIDAAERDEGDLWLVDHKAVNKWGDAQQREAVLSVQKYLNCWLWWKVKGEIPAGFAFTVLKKTKEPEVFRWAMEAPTRDELVDFEGQLHAYAAIARHHKTLGRPVRAVQQKCGWCSFAPLCWNVDGARDLFVDRNERRKLEGKADDADDLDEVDAEE